MLGIVQKLKLTSFVILIFLAVCLYANIAFSFELTSPAFINNGMIPLEYTCRGQSISPELIWSNAPQNTKSFLVIVDDADSTMGTWTHWVLFNLPATISRLEKGLTNKNRDEHPLGSKQGLNSWHRPGYGAPCPPSGVHHYSFRIYALDTILPLNNNATLTQIAAAKESRVIAIANLTGLVGK